MAGYLLSIKIYFMFVIGPYTTNVESLSNLEYILI